MVKFAMVLNTGLISYIINPSNDEQYIDGEVYSGLLAVSIPYETNNAEFLQTKYYKEGVWKTKTTQPTIFHYWDVNLEVWLEDVDAANKNKLLEVTKTYNNICSGTYNGQQIYVDCLTANGTFRMNAGQTAATNMDAGVRIFELSGADYMPIVRDFNNVNHADVPIADARSIALQQGVDALTHWQRKGELVDAINACTTVAEVEAIEITFNTSENL